MPSYAALHDEIVKPAYDGLTDEQIADALKAMTVLVNVDIGVGDVEGYLRLNARLAALEDWVAANPTPSAARSCAREMLGLISGKVSVLKTSDPTTRGILVTLFSALVAAGAGGITQTDSDNLFSLATAHTSWAAQNEWNVVGAGDVAVARNL